MRRKRDHSQNGQVVVEYLMLLSLAFITAYLMITGPVATLTRLIVVTIRSSLENVVHNGEIRAGERINPGEAGHPSDPARGKALHL